MNQLFNTLNNSSHSDNLAQPNRQLSAMSLPQLQRLQLLRSFRSRDDFRMSEDSSMKTDPEQLRTPKALKSRTTSIGRPQHDRVKNNLPMLTLNDSISSNQTRPSQDQQVGRDQPSAMTAEFGQSRLLNLADNREVSPAPVSHFAPRTHGGHIGHNRVTGPFHRAASFKINSSSLE